MIVRCESCQTEFSLDDGQITPEGVTVRCSVCAFVFRVERPAGGSADQPWQIRTVEDLLFTAPDIATLRTWIEEGRLHPEDQVSRTGRNWLRLGDIAEFADAFSSYRVVPPVMRVVPSTERGLAETSAARAKPDAERSAVDELGPPPDFAGSSRDVPSGDAAGKRATSAPIRVSSPPIPAPVAAAGADARPSSMLGVVTQHAVRPITGPNLATEAARAKLDAPASALDEPVAEPRGRRPRAESLDSEEVVAERGVGSFASHADKWESRPRPARSDSEVLGVPRKRGHGGLFALLGVVAALGIMFGVPDLRNWLLNLGQGGGAVEDEGGPVVLPELAAADAAMGALGAADLAAAENDIQRAIDRGGHSPRELEALKVAQADLLATRALLTMMTAAIEPKQADELASRARDDLDRAARVFDSIQAPGDADAIKLARARIRLAEGRAAEEVEALLPGAGADEMKLVCAGASLWRDAKAPVPARLVADLRAAEDLGPLGKSLLALALLRGGDRSGARNVAERLLTIKDDQPVAAAIARATGDGEAVVADAAEDAAETDTPPAKVDGESPTGPVDAAVADAGKPGDKKPKAGGGGGGGKASLDELLEKGCAQVDAGQAGPGVATLMRAFDKDPGNVDVLVCLGRGHSKKGDQSQAMHFYELALQRSSKHRGALKGAAEAAAKAGSEAKAMALYERLLQVDPTNGQAKLYLAQHGKKPEPEAPAPAPAPAPSGDPPPP